MRLTGTPSWLRNSRGPEAREPIREEPLPAEVWAFGGGKGGIGKSFLVTNLATVAARSGRRVIVIDADLGGGPIFTPVSACAPRSA